MPGAAARAGFRRRILASAHTIDVVYPPKRVPAPGSAPTPTAPANPLTGPRTTPVLAPVVLTPAKAPVTALKCLWYDQTIDATQHVVGAESRRFPLAGWREGTIAVCACWLADVLLDPAMPAGKTVFSECDAVVHLGTRYHVLGADLSGSGGALPHALYVWLGAGQ
jgi:hypothetical protein